MTFRPTPRLWTPAGLGLLLALTTAPLQAAEPAAASSSTTNAPAPKPPLVLARGSLTNRVQLDAVVESARMTPVSIDAKAWLDLTVLEAAPHGAKVRAGDVLLRLDTTRLQEQLDELEADRPAADLALQLAAAELENLRQTTPARIEAARRARRIADEDAAHFLASGRERREKGARFNLKRAEQDLAGAREELQQLQKMYDADDLTEETEEIVLKRQKFAVEAAEWGLEVTRQSTERELGTAIPREGEHLQAQRRDQELALRYLEETANDTLARKTAEVEKLRRERRKADRRIADLQKDLESFTVRATFDGIVYHGACENGRWTTAGGVTKRLVRGGKLQPNETVLTLTAASPLQLRAVAQESDLSRLPAAATGHFTPAADFRRRLPVRLLDLGSILLPSGGFDARLTFQDPEAAAAARLTPGMTGKLAFESVRANALLAPKDAVFGEGDQRFVYLSPAEGAPTRRPVRVGDADGTSLEIVEGLAEGDRILATKPD